MHCVKKYLFYLFTLFVLISHESVSFNNVRDRKTSLHSLPLCHARFTGFSHVLLNHLFSNPEFQMLLPFLRTVQTSQSFWKFCSAISQIHYILFQMRQPQLYTQYISIPFIVLFYIAFIAFTFSTTIAIYIELPARTPSQDLFIN